MGAPPRQPGNGGLHVAAVAAVLLMVMAPASAYARLATLRPVDSVNVDDSYMKVQDS